MEEAMDHQADQMSVVRFNMASKVFVLNNFIGSVNSVRWVHYESWSRGSLAPVR
jgi:hypothetical protein